ncbi:Uncharacterised protein [Mycobacteroides abscessus]|nr:Uncharacterised protein [Mycobacteroides abscessus]
MTPSSSTAALAMTAWKPAPLSASMTGVVVRKTSSAPAGSPASKRRTTSANCGATACADTETIPAAPCARNGSSSPSSPL